MDTEPRQAVQPMAMKKELSRLPITAVDSRGRGRGTAVAGDDTERAVYVTGAYPGDVVDLKVRRQKGAWHGEITSFHPGTGPRRRPPFCAHFADCGGCTIQDIGYLDQLAFKEAIVTAAFTEAGFPELSDAIDRYPILPAPAERRYRNKLEFSFGAHRWLSEAEIADAETITDRRGLGFHAHGRFDRVIDLTECHLQPEPSESIRSFLREYSLREGLSFYDAREHHGLMRLLIIRTSLSGETMVIVMFGEDDPDEIGRVMTAVGDRFPEITSLNYVVNTSRNDALAPHLVHRVRGAEWITEQCGPNTLRIRPKAFYQTNPAQAVNLYQRAVDLAALRGNEVVYDLYCGIGSIALFVAPSVRHVVGIELVEDAIVAARENARVNEIRNVTFRAGAVEDVLPDAIAEHGPPDLVFLDPPRVGLHPNARRTLRELAPERIVYVSCNPRTQAADIADLGDLYEIAAMQPVDMFPQTRHVESIVLLRRR
ncbi:MAG: 23S rRNA (uracil(1939)-C(5))-methyltransferase RlmD [Alkalispirochaeta sp.]